MRIHLPRIVIIVLVLAAVIALVIVGTRTLTPRGTLNITIDPNSQVKTGVLVYLSNDKFKASHTLPFSTALKAGRYQVYSTGPDADPTTDTITITANQTSNLAVHLNRLPQIGQTEITPTEEEFQNNQYLKALPHTEKDFIVDGKLDRDDTGKIIVDYLTITALNDSGQTGINEGKKWITDQKIFAGVSVIIQ